MYCMNDLNSIGRRLGIVPAAVLAAVLLATSGMAADPKGLTDDEIAILRVSQTVRRIDTIEYDMRLFTLEAERRPEGENWTVGHIKDLEKRISSLALTKETEPLRAHMLQTASSLLAVAKAAEVSDEAVGAAIQVYFGHYDALDTDYNRLMWALWRVPEVLPEEDVVAMNTLYMPDEETKAAFLKASALIDSRHFDEALALVMPLREQVKGQKGEGRVLEMILECRMRRRNAVGEGTAYGELLALVEDYLKRRVYSPRNSHLYFYWQTLQQIAKNGLSNFSDIDYELHHRVFGEQLDLVMAYVQANPEDTWARRVCWSLLAMPPIERFAQNAFGGSSVILHNARLSRFSDYEPENKPDAAEK